MIMVSTLARSIAGRGKRGDICEFSEHTAQQDNREPHCSTVYVRYRTTMAERSPNCALIIPNRQRATLEQVIVNTQCRGVWRE